MTLRKRTLLIIVLTLVSLLGVLFSVVSTIMLNGFAQVERDDTLKNIQRVNDALSDEISKLSLTVQDWSNWDDSYKFVEDHNEEFIQSNLQEKSLTNLKLGLMVYLDSQGQVIFGTGVDTAQGILTPLPASFETYLQNGELRSEEANPTKIAGVLFFDETPMLVVARPIFNSDSQGPSHGTLIMGRPLDALTVKALSDRTHLQIKIERYGGLNLPADFQLAQGSLSPNQASKTFIKPVDDHIIAGYTLVNDLANKPGLLLQVELPRDVYQQGQLTLNYFIISLLIVGLIFGLVTLLLLEKSVLNPLARLSTNVKAIRTSQDVGARVSVKGKDELSSLGHDINLMLEGLGQAQATQRESEERYRQLVELSPDTIVVQSQGKLSFINSAGTKLIGAPSPDQLEGKEFFRFIKTDNPLQALQGWLQPENANQVDLKEHQLVRLDGRIVDVEIATVPIVYQGQPAAQSIVRDITGRKQAELLERDRNKVLEMVATNQPLSDVLAQLLRMIERQQPEAQGAIVLQNGRLYQNGGPALPEELVLSVHGSMIGPEAATQGTPTYPSSNLTVTRLAGNNELRKFREIIFAKRLHTVWTNLIFAGNGQVLGSINVFFPTAYQPERVDEVLLELACKLAAISIEQRHLTTQLAYQAHHDSLTGLPNRLFFEEHFQRTISQVAQSGDAAALLFFDLDRFKIVNDTLGHHIGDCLLQQVAQRLKRSVRRNDIVARMGGDEFTIILAELNDPDDAVRVAQKIVEAFQTPFVIQGHELKISGSLGVSLLPSDGQTTEELLKKADSAMYQAKENGRNNYQLFAMELSDAKLERLELEKDLSKALERGELSLHYQPLLQLDSGQIIGVEALLRWNHPTLGQIPPATFIPIAEESGLIIEVGNWVLKEACLQNKAWQRSGLANFKVAVNVSALQFQQADLVETVAGELKRSGLDPRWLELEITESVVMNKIDQTALQLSRLRQLGVSISIDDFGTGYSSLNYLRRLPIDTIKIDRSFISDLNTDGPEISSEGAIILAITTMAHNLNLKVLAEGVETAAQLEFLSRIGCNQVQGYYFLRPTTSVELEEWARRLNIANKAGFLR
jgi:diguanylate cyclase (GGDEF)-like protein/PAS domain S-box-containing protein